MYLEAANYLLKPDNFEPYFRNDFNFIYHWNISLAFSENRYSKLAATFHHDFQILLINDIKVK